MAGIEHHGADVVVGVFALLTISIGEELESRFFKVLSCVSAQIIRILI